MPKRTERMAGYIRESDPSLANSTTIESAAKAVRQYGEKEGYLYDPGHEYQPTYQELRLAVRIIGIRALIYPTKGDYEFRWQIFATVPEVLKKVDCVMIGPLLKSSSAAA